EPVPPARRRRRGMQLHLPRYQRDAHGGTPHRPFSGCARTGRRDRVRPGAVTRGDGRGVTPADPGRPAEPAPMSRPHDPTAGAPLPLASVALLAVSALGAEPAPAGRTALRIAGARRDTTEALAAADGCLARAVHALPPGWDFDAPLRGRDDIANTADDGVLDAPPGCIALLAAAPGGGAPSRALAAVLAETPRARWRPAAVIGRALTAGAGTLIWATDRTALGLPSGSLDLDGVDHGVPAHEPLGLIGAPNEPSELDAWATILGA